MQQATGISYGSPMFNSYWAQLGSLQVNNGMLYRVWELVTGLAEVLREKSLEILEELYGGVSGRHLGISKMLKKVQ